MHTTCILLAAILAAQPGRPADPVGEYVRLARIEAMKQKATIQQRIAGIKRGPRNPETVAQLKDQEAQLIALRNEPPPVPLDDWTKVGSVGIFSQRQTFKVVSVDLDAKQFVMVRVMHRVEDVVEAERVDENRVVVRPKVEKTVVERGSPITVKGFAIGNEPGSMFKMPKRTAFAVTGDGTIERIDMAAVRKRYAK